MSRQNGIATLNANADGHGHDVQLQSQMASAYVERPEEHLSKSTWSSGQRMPLRVCEDSLKVDRFPSGRLIRIQLGTHAHDRQATNICDSDIFSGCLSCWILWVTWATNP
jgi:hypothetical protein